jgi:hypothetical protein
MLGPPMPPPMPSRLPPHSHTAITSHGHTSRLSQVGGLLAAQCHTALLAGPVAWLDVLAGESCALPAGGWGRPGGALQL